MPKAVELRALQREDASEAAHAQEELAAEDFDFLLDPESESFGDYLAALTRMHEGRELAPHIVPSTYLGAFVDGKLVGRVSIRHTLNERLTTVGGHIGYAVRPSYRGRGYATEILERVLSGAAVT